MILSILLRCTTRRMIARSDDFEPFASLTTRRMTARSEDFEHFASLHYTQNDSKV